jgi:hypothetical protein
MNNLKRLMMTNVGRNIYIYVYETLKYVSEIYVARKTVGSMVRILTVKI